MTERAHPQDREFASVLEHLITSREDPDGRAWTNVSLAAALRDEGIPVTPPYLSQLRSGARTNPTLTFLRGLAKVLGVTLAALDSDDESQRVRDALDLQRAMTEQGIAGIALRAQGLSPQALAIIAQNIELARKLEGHSAASFSDDQTAEA